jgi:hypothetical protein
MLPARDDVSRWIVTAAGVQERYPAPRLRDERIELLPAAVWRIEGSRESGVVSRRVFEGVGSLPVFLFHPESFRLVADQRQVSTPAVLVLLPTSGQVVVGGGKQAVREVAEFPPLFGEWGGYRAVELDVSDESSIEISVDGLVERVSTSARRGRASLVGSPVAGVRTADGHLVYDGLPRLMLPPGASPREWTVSVESDSTSSVTCDELPQDAAGFRLDPIGGEAPFGLVAVRARGPLGSDLVEEIAVVEGLSFKRPLEPVAPREDLRCQVRAESGIELSSSNGDVRFGPGVDRLSLTARRGSSRLDLSLSIPRLLWSVVSHRRPEAVDSDEVIRLQPEDFTDADLHLVVRTGVAADVRLVAVADDGGVVQVLGKKRTSAAHGRWRFSLQRAADTVRAIDADRLHFRVELGALAVDAVVVERRMVVTGLCAEVRAAGSHSAMTSKTRCCSRSATACRQARTSSSCCRQTVRNRPLSSGKPIPSGSSSRLELTPLPSPLAMTRSGEPWLVPPLSTPSRGPTSMPPTAESWPS